MHYNKIFLAFLNEALFTKELLGIGVTQLYKANYATKGIYYQSFVCLSTGIERLEKLCLIVDYYTKNSGNLPSEKYIRNYSHKIQDLYKACNEIAKNQKINFYFKYQMDKDICQSIIELLGKFAETTGRYSNINILLGREDKSNNCIEQWFEQVDMKLFDRHISARKKADIKRQAILAESILNPFSLIEFIGEDNIELTNVLKASERTGIWEAVAPYRQLYLLQIIRYLVEILIELQYKAMKFPSEDIPYFSEIFGVFYNKNSFFRSRKTWDNL